MNTAKQGEASAPVRRPSVWMALLLYTGYLAIFFATWFVNGVDYTRIGESAQTTKLWYALPTLLGGAFLVAAISCLGWWRLVLFDAKPSPVRWVWALPAFMAGVILSRFIGLNTDKLSADLLLWSLLGAVGVGFGEEMITRGSMIVGLRSRFAEPQVWLISTLLFSALHMPNALFGLPLWQMPFQLVLTFIMGGGFYVMRRVSGTLLWPMLLHGLWDSSLFLSVATGVQPSVVQFAVYPIALVCVFAVLRNDPTRSPRA